MAAWLMPTLAFFTPVTVWTSLSLGVVCGAFESSRIYASLYEEGVDGVV
jgi:hypothetical protein